MKRGRFFRAKIVNFQSQLLGRIFLRKLLLSALLGIFWFTLDCEAKLWTLQKVRFYINLCMDKFLAFLYLWTLPICNSNLK